MIALLRVTYLSLTLKIPIDVFKAALMSTEYNGRRNQLETQTTKVGVTQGTRLGEAMKPGCFAAPTLRVAEKNVKSAKSVETYVADINDNQIKRATFFFFFYGAIHYTLGFYLHCSIASYLSSLLYFW